MTTGRITSAGRLLNEVMRIKGAVNDPNAMYVWIPALFGADGRHWTRGVSAYARLCEQFVEEAACLEGARIERFRNASEAAAQIIQPIHFASSAQALIAAHLGDLTVERLESADELLLSAGRFISVDRENLRMLRDQLFEIKEEIRSCPKSEFDEVLLNKIGEILCVLDRYDLFGPEGVQSAVSDLVGRTALAQFYVVPMPEQTVARVKRTFGILKAVLDLLVYGKAGFEALEWSSQSLGGFLPGS